MPGPTDQRGAALVMALAAVVLLTTLGTGLVLLVTTEVRLAGHYRDGVQALYAAEAALERAMLDLAATGHCSAPPGPASPGEGPTPPGADEPGWHLCLEGWLHETLPEVPDQVPVRVAVWARDDQPEGDGLLVLRAQADGPAGARRVLEASVARDGAGVRMLWWREWR